MQKKQGYIMKNKLYTALIVFTFVFCAPALLYNAFASYNAAGHKLGKYLYEMSHADEPF